MMTRACFRLAPVATALLACGALAQQPAGAPPPTPAAVPSDAESSARPGGAGHDAPAYSYEVRGRRDPFRSLLLRKQNENDRQRPPGVAGCWWRSSSCRGRSGPRPAGSR